MNLRPNASIAAKLTRMNLLVSGSVLLLAALAFFSYDLFSFRNSLIHSLSAEAQILGENSVSAMMFDDRESAETTMHGLERTPDVEAAVLRGEDGKEFAPYGDSPWDEIATHKLAAGENEHVWRSGSYVLVADRIVFQGKTVGTVLIYARLWEIGQRARQYLLIAGTILMLCMITAVGISSLSRRLIAKPIIELAETVLVVSRDGDYSVRAKREGDGSEISVLVTAFNTMLGQIQERDAELNEARAELETRVQERTAELQAANRELEAFSYTVAHDLRGPLDSIGGLGYLLAQSSVLEKDESARQMLEQHKASVGHMAALIDDLLNFARASTASVRKLPVDMSAMAREIAAELTLGNPARQVQFSIHDVPLVLADPALMRVVMDNLLRNAWKYTSLREHACIDFGCKVEGGDGRLVYFVRDDGAGFDQTKAAQLFQPFERLHAKSEFPGTGIGLATVERILVRQGGAIWAEGVVDKGAVFRFTLPG